MVKNRITQNFNHEIKPFRINRTALTMNFIETIPLRSTLQRLINEGKTIRQIGRYFDQEVANTRVELYNTGVPDQEIQQHLVRLNANIDEVMASSFSRQGQTFQLPQPPVMNPFNMPPGLM